MSTAPSRWAVETQALSKTFGTLRALRGVDLQVGWGERWAVFGPNGAGKTTLIRILAGVMRPSGGRVLIAGGDARHQPGERRRLLGVVSHQTYVYDDLTVREQLELFGRLYDVPDPRTRVEEVLVQVGLERRAAERARNLSRGMQQRLTIARAILHRPAVLLLDEPDTGLDLEATEHLTEMLKAATSEGRTVVMTTHNIGLGHTICDHWALLVHGSILSSSNDPASARSLPALYRQYVGAGDRVCLP